LSRGVVEVGIVDHPTSGSRPRADHSSRASLQIAARPSNRTRAK
jgi:hypothetical protein